MSYPPEPWTLCGDLHLSLWRVPTDRLPAVGNGLSPVVLGGSGVVGAAWVRYGPGSVLEYNELLTAVLVRRGARLRPSITHIWVDDEQSERGGRELWGIPKRSATFDLIPGERTWAAAHGIATATLTARRSLPGTWPLRYTLAQNVPGLTSGVQESPVSTRSRVELTRAEWTVDPGGPLGWLRGRPLLSASLRDFRMRFGAEQGG